jgi:hypothetical protein
MELDESDGGDVQEEDEIRLTMIVENNHMSTIRQEVSPVQ